MVMHVCSSHATFFDNICSNFHGTNISTYMWQLWVGDWYMNYLLWVHHQELSWLFCKFSQNMSFLVCCFCWHRKCKLGSMLMWCCGWLMLHLWKTCNEPPTGGRQRWVVLFVFLNGRESAILLWYLLQGTRLRIVLERSFVSEAHLNIAVSQK